MKNRVMKNIYLIIIFSAIAFFSSSAIYLIENSINKETSKNNFLSNDKVKFSIDFKKGSEVEEHVLDLEEDYVILKEEVEGADSYGIYFNGNLKKSFPIMEGRFFESKDFNINQRTAVVGKNLIDYITYEDGEKYYYLKNNYYKVIGILGDEKRETAYDDEVFVNLDSIIGDDKFNLKGKYALDAGNKSRDIVEEIKEKYKDSSVEIEDISNTSNRSIIKRLKDDYSSVVIHIIKVLFILILSILLVTSFWIRDKSKEIGIRRALGASKINVSIKILSELIFINISSFLLGYFLYLLLSFFKDGYFHFYFISMVFVFLITLFTGLISAIIPIYKANKMQPSEIMR